MGKWVASLLFVYFVHWGGILFLGVRHFDVGGSSLSALLRFLGDGVLFGVLFGFFCCLVGIAVDTLLVRSSDGWWAEAGVQTFDRNRCLRAQGFVRFIVGAVIMYLSLLFSIVIYVVMGRSGVHADYGLWLLHALLLVFLVFDLLCGLVLIVGDGVIVQQPEGMSVDGCKRR